MKHTCPSCQIKHPKSNFVDTKTTRTGGAEFTCQHCQAKLVQSGMGTAIWSVGVLINVSMVMLRFFDMPMKPSELLLSLFAAVTCMVVGFYLMRPKIKTPSPVYVDVHKVNG